MPIFPIPEALAYVKEGCYADGALRNWKSLADKVEGAGTMERMMILNDPQTSGGLLISCSKELIPEITALVARVTGNTSIISAFSMSIRKVH